MFNIFLVEDDPVISGAIKSHLEARGDTGYNGRTDKKATGLGLYLSKRVTDKLGHGLSVSSSQSGTTVKIDLSRRDIDLRG